MDYERELEIAAAALVELEELHTTFVNTVSALAKPTVNGGLIGVADNELFAECLGVTLSGKHKAVVRDGHLAALEYPFTARHKEQDLLVYSMYLEASGDLYADSKEKEKICSSRNTYLPGHIVSRLAVALLRSELFAPNT